MKSSALVFASFRHYWRSHLGLLFGAFLASAVLSGSLLVGDSVRASLRLAAAERLGGWQSGLVGGDRWFTEDLARRNGAAPVIVLRGSVSESTGRARANAVQVLGVEPSFFDRSPSGRSQSWSKEGVAINASLARRLAVKAGDTVLVRLEKPSAISRDAPLSGESNQDVTLRRTVERVLEGGDFGNFQLQASPASPDNVFIALPDLAAALGKKGRVNAMLSAGSLAGLKSATLGDYGLKLTRPGKGGEEWELTTDRVFLDDAVARKLLPALPGGYGVLTYLVNGLGSAKGRTPYSMVTALPPGVQATKLGLQGGQAPGSPGSAVITQWLADDLQVGVGDSMEIRYFVVGVGRELREETARFTVGGVLPMSDPAVNPTWAPEFPGVSDATNCRDWQPGIPMKLDTIRDKDEDYWKQYKTTPKAFIALEAGQKLWSNRFGNLTGLRFPNTGQNEGGLREQLVNNLQLGNIGLVARDFKSEAAAAAQGSVDFGGLFVGLSLFLIASALVFSSLLFVFTLERRAAQLGLLFSIGWREKAVRSLILREAGLISLMGTVLGLLGGLAYTQVAITGLNSIWSGATGGLRLVHHFEPATLVIAGLSSLLAGLGTLWLASRRIFQAQPKDLLVGNAWAVRLPVKAGKAVGWRARVVRLLPVLLVVLTAGLSFAGSRATDPEAIAGLFFGSGFCLLAAGLLVIRRGLVARGGQGQESGGGLASVSAIGFRNVTRRPGRSLSVIGMMAGGIFLVIAVNSFRIGAGPDAALRSSGTGGFALLGESTLPVYEDLNGPAAWDAFALDEKLMKQVRVVPFRMREGDDASCLNLNKAQRPVLCAVNPEWLAAQKAFAFAAGSWESLNGESGGAIPALADQATAQWGLGKGVGDTLRYTDAQGREFPVKLVGLLAGSVLQGKVVIGERDFLSKFPDAAGYRFFLIDTPAGRSAEVASHLSKQLETRGLAIESAAARLDAFNAVQNTYIGIFTVLGGLGVLLGTFGLGVLAMRNVLERRGEFGLMQALGFRAGVLRRMVLDEHAALLVIGLVLGLVSAGVAVWPSLRQSAGDLPLGFLVRLNVLILVFGIAACWLAAALALRGRLLDAVRRE